MLILSQINLAQFILYIFFSPETLYIRGAQHPQQITTLKQYVAFGRVNPAPLTFRRFFEPLLLFKHINIVVVIISYAAAFNFVLVLISVEIPVLFGQIFHLLPQELGLNFLGILVGRVLFALNR
jgi:hypothetical protein